MFNQEKGKGKGQGENGRLKEGRGRKGNNVGNAAETRAEPTGEEPWYGAVKGGQQVVVRYGWQAVAGR